MTKSTTRKGELGHSVHKQASRGTGVKEEQRSTAHMVNKHREKADGFTQPADTKCSAQKLECTLWV